MKIGIDIDEVLCELLKGCLKFAKESKGLKKDYDDFYNYNWWEILEIPREDAFKLMDDFCLTEGFNNVSLVEGSKESIKILSENHELFFITARPKWLREKTKKFISKNFNGVGEIIFSGDLHGENKTKEEICEENGIKVMVEDHGPWSEKYAKNGLQVILLDKPWNKEFEHENIHRADNWREVLEKIKEIELNEQGELKNG